jgi:hypothetical protein
MRDRLERWTRTLGSEEVLYWMVLTQLLELDIFLEALE